MECQTCQKPQRLCLCGLIEPQENQTEILILQHPQEPDHLLGTARMAHLALKNSLLKIGLSWPNIKAALGKPANPSHWVVLYLGSGLKEEKAEAALQLLSKKNKPIPRPTKIDGVILLDGTWSQAKTLWWRNPWLLKVNRAILTPSKPSLYKGLRKEPRPECLSTIESIAETLTALGEKPEIGNYLRDLFQELLTKYKKS